jgi:hypothetical protein
MQAQNLPISNRAEELIILADSLFEKKHWEKARMNYVLAFSALDGDSIQKHVMRRKMADALRMDSKFGLATEEYFEALHALRKLKAEEEIIVTLSKISIHLSSRIVHSLAFETFFDYIQ